MAMRTIRILAGLCLAASLSSLDVNQQPFSSGAPYVQLSGAAHASTPLRWQEELTRVLQNPVFLARIVGQMGVPSEQEHIYFEHLQKGWGHDAVVQAFMRDVEPLVYAMNAEGAEGVSRLASNFSAAWFQEKILMGIKRLGSEDQRNFFHYAVLMMETITPQQCAAMAREELSAPEMAHAEIQAFSQLPSSDLRAYLALARRAIIAEVTDTPPVRTLGPSQRMVVEETISMRLVDELETHPDGEAFWVGIDRPDVLTDEQLCDFHLLILNLAIGTEGQIGDWSVRYLLE